MILIWICMHFQCSNVCTGSMQKNDGMVSETPRKERKTGRRTAAGVVQGWTQGVHGGSWLSWVSWRPSWSSGRRQGTSCSPPQARHHRWLHCRTASLTPLLPANSPPSQSASLTPYHLHHHTLPPPPHPHSRAGPGGREWTLLRSSCFL